MKLLLIIQAKLGVAIDGFAITELSVIFLKSSEKNAKHAKFFRKGLKEFYFFLCGLGVLPLAIFAFISLLNFTNKVKK